MSLDGFTNIKAARVQGRGLRQRTMWWRESLNLRAFILRYKSQEQNGVRWTGKMRKRSIQNKLVSLLGLLVKIKCRTNL